MPSAFDLQGKTALVTGAKRGLGMGIALGLARAGADIIGVSATQESEGSEIQGLVEQEGRSFVGRKCDFARRADTHELVDWITANDHTVDILINNAGTIRRNPATDHTDEDWDQVLETNLSAPFILTRGLAKGMIDRGQGKVVFIASMLSFQGGINVSSYTAAKSGIAGLTKALSNEWASQGLNVNAIAPGYMTTDNTRALQDDPVRARAILERIPAGHWGAPNDLAGAAVFLSSAASDYIHGAILTVDGGWLGR
jgi:2-deoxy-D-gluconate 3-dehydrogenase